MNIAIKSCMWQEMKSLLELPEGVQPHQHLKFEFLPSRTMRKNCFKPCNMWWLFCSSYRKAVQISIYYKPNSTLLHLLHYIIYCLLKLLRAKGKQLYIYSVSHFPFLVLLIYCPALRFPYPIQLFFHPLPFTVIGNFVSFLYIISPEICLYILLHAIGFLKEERRSFWAYLRRSTLPLSLPEPRRSFLDVHFENLVGFLKVKPIKVGMLPLHPNCDLHEFLTLKIVHNSASSNSKSPFRCS